MKTPEETEKTELNGKVKKNRNETRYDILRRHSRKE